MAKKAARASKPSGKAARPATRKSAPARKSTPTRKAAPARKAASRKAAPAASAKADKFVYSWGAGKADGNGSMKPLLGGKGANLAEMANLGLPVPPGFTIPTSVCTYFYAHDKSYPPALKTQVEKALDHAGIHCNKNMIPFDKKPALTTSGIRLGTPAGTTRGLGAAEFAQVARWIALIAKDPTNTQLQEAVQADVMAMVSAFPVPA